jgi:hypothetical protein
MTDGRPGMGSRHPLHPDRRGFLYLVVIMDWPSRAVLSWRLSNTMDALFCVETLEETLAQARPVATALGLRLGGRHLPQARLDEEKQCVLVLIGAAPEGRMELVGFFGGSLGTPLVTSHLVVGDLARSVVGLAWRRSVLLILRWTVNLLGMRCARRP